MLTLINANRMTPAIGPIGLDYVAGSAACAGINAEVFDLCFAEDPSEALKEHFASQQPELVGVSFRNADDSFWLSADWFVPELKRTVETVRAATEAPIVIGGVGFSIFAGEIIEFVGADFGIRGDGETAIVSLVRQLRGAGEFAEVPGLIWRSAGEIRNNQPCWPEPFSAPTARSFVDNARYFREGGQCGVETKRGCNRRCIYCADPLAKGGRVRLRDPCQVADEVESLLLQGIDVLHLCDSEFNVPPSHAKAICKEFTRRLLGDKVRWYAYASPTGFDAELAALMARAGCVGINFTGDSACGLMLRTYRQEHSREDLARAVRLCRRNGIAVMIDLLLGGPGETPQTVQETIDFLKKINPDCAGAALGVRVYPGTVMGEIAAQEYGDGKKANIRRKYSGPIDLFKPTFYVSEALGERPAELVRDLIDGDQRFFEPDADASDGSSQSNGPDSYNYNENLPLVEAIRKGARGAYWDILRRLRGL